MPDLARSVLAALPAPSPGRRRMIAGARAALVGVALLQALLAWTGALTGQDDMATGHVAHEVGAWNLALAVAFLMVATRPRAADALVTPVGVFVAVLAVVAATDAAGGDLAPGRLVGHLLVGTGFALLVTIGRTAAAPPGGPDRSRPRGLPTGSDDAAGSDSGANPDMVPTLDLVRGRMAPSVRAGSAAPIQRGSAA